MTDAQHTERPVLFAVAMSRKIRDRIKTVTRREINPQPPAAVGWTHVGPCRWLWEEEPPSETRGEVRCRYGEPGDVLWVRECFAVVDGRPLYRADESATPPRWRPSIHMPRTLCRTQLLVVSVWPEPLQAIDDDEARREGFADLADFTAGWDALNEKRGFGFDRNPWVFRIEFVMISED